MTRSTLRAVLFVPPGMLALLAACGSDGSSGPPHGNGVDASSSDAAMRAGDASPSDAAADAGADATADADAAADADATADAGAGPDARTPDSGDASATDGSADASDANTSDAAAQDDGGLCTTSESLQAWCGGACADWTATVTRDCTHQTNGGVILTVGCGAFNLLTHHGVDTGTVEYFNASTGALIGAVQYGLSPKFGTCAGTVPACTGGVVQACPVPDASADAAGD